MIAENQGKNVSRRTFLKGLGALALLALPACRRAQQFAVQPDECPEWMLPGEATCFATCMPWATGAIPMLAICHDGLPVALQSNPRYEAVKRGVPAFAQASILDLYDENRPDTPTRAGKPHPMQALHSSLRAWSRLLQEGRKIAFLFPAGYSAVRMEQVAELKQYAGACFFEYDTVAEPRCGGFAELESLQNTAFGPAVRYESGFGNLDALTAMLPELDALFIFTPADAAAFHEGFARALEGTPAETVRFVLRKPDYTANLCLYTVPQTHFLEEWGAEADAAGNLCLRQPVTQPLRPALAEAEVLHALLNNGELADTTQGGVSTARRWLERVVPNLESALRSGLVIGGGTMPVSQDVLSAGELNFYLHPYYVDGRFSHNLWLRETYLPLSGWAGEAEVYLPGNGSFCGVQVGARVLPAWAHRGVQGVWMPMMPQYVSVSVQDLHTVEPPPLPYCKTAILPELCREAPHVNQKQASPQWAMVIDQSLCIGCSSCVLACRAENNIPTVGTEEQRYGRDLQWLRINRYLDNTGFLHYVPMACRQCEAAPCEAVCPVNATMHTDSGLNAMVYPRCWGTRYCAAACPYNARVFNFRDYSKQEQIKTHRPHNPQVTLRSRGVMEKCTYCVQRINAAGVDASTPQTACQQACPVGAIKLINLCESTLPERVITAYDVPGTRPRTWYI